MIVFYFLFHRNEIFNGPNVEYVDEAEDTLEIVLNMNVDEVAEKWYVIMINYNVTSMMILFRKFVFTITMRQHEKVYYF